VVGGAWVGGGTCVGGAVVLRRSDGADDFGFDAAAEYEG